MDYADLFGKLITFPVVILTMIFMFSKEIKALVHRLGEHFDRENTSTEIPKRLDKLKDLVNQFKIPDVRDDEEKGFDKAEKLPEARYKMLAKLSPQSSIIETLIDIEAYIYGLAKSINIHDPLTSKEIVDRLGQEGVIGPIEKQVLGELLNITDQLRFKEEAGYVQAHADTYRNVVKRMLVNLQITSSS